MIPSSVLNNIEYRTLTFRSIIKEEICNELGWSATEYHNRQEIPDITNHKTAKVHFALTQDERLKIQSVVRRILSESGSDIAKPVGHILLRELQNNILIRKHYERKKTRSTV